MAVSVPRDRNDLQVDDTERISLTVARSGSAERLCVAGQSKRAGLPRLSLEDERTTK